ncbi:TIGR03571 family LLM class oxidoreductase [Streptomyces sp. SKN60]|uniref:TIGR03571 family LLM class oxidoreductase n=1 Tax=Streptomyces sp. SKN60 TaxID=2855506 RepID=UPI0022468A1C|nr:TIGR03571 family LLM class oxidoreductase [Streptomyces sp. SKN60]MCX2184153.1 TIGR03571 family LLM class oxidoreductase [Streptomyces sp. SKN60]
MSTPHSSLARLAPAAGRLTLGLELPLDNDWGVERGRADRAAGRPFGVPDLTAQTRLARLADRLGFAALWLRDVPLYDPVAFGDAGSVFETFTHLGHLAAVTENVVLATGAIVLPLREPLLVAKAAATVDVLSGGRMLLGLASGDRPVEYPLFGRDFDGRGTAFREGVETLRAAWRPGPLQLPGRGLDADRRLEVLPRPVAPAGIPIAVAGGAQQTPAWIAEHADASLNYPRDLGALRLRLREWRELTGGAAGGTDGGTGGEKPYLTPMVLGLQEDPAAPARPIRLGLSTGREALIGHLGRMAELGVSHVSFNLRPNDRPVEELLHELAEYVLPHFPTPTAAAATSLH